MELKQFATKNFPVRASSLPKLLQCSGRAVLEMLAQLPETHSTPADTGTAVHYAVAKFHTGSKPQEALEAMKNASSTFPLANLEVAEAHAAAYFKDSRNQSHPKVVEEAVNFCYKGVYIKGTLDQVRIDAYDCHNIWDIKTGAPQPLEMVTDYSVQLAAYTLAYAAMNPKVRVKCGGIIRTAGYWYRKKPVEDVSVAPVFVKIELDLVACSVLLDSVVARVQEIRKGKVLFTPNSLICNRCDYKTPEVCIPTSRTLLKRIPLL